MKLSLKHVVVVGILGLQVVSVTAIVASSYLTAEAVVMEITERAMRHLAGDTSERLQGFLTPARKAAVLTKRLAEGEVLRSGDTPAKERFFFETLRLNPWLDGIFFGGKDGSFVFTKPDSEHTEAGFLTKIISTVAEERRVDLILRGADFDKLEHTIDPDDRFDPRTRPWFENAIAAEGPTWSDPYIFFSSQRPGISTAIAVRDQDGRITGVAGVDIEIAGLSNFLAEIDLGKEDAAFILDRDGSVIAFPDLDSVRPTSTLLGDGLQFAAAEMLGDPVARAALLGADAAVTAVADLEPGGEVFHHFAVDGRRYISVMVPFPSRDWEWILGLYIPEDRILGEIRDNQLFNIYLAIAIGALACTVAFLIWRHIGRSLTTLRQEAGAIAAGHFDQPLDVKSPYREIADTAQDFRRMADSLGEREREGARLTASLREELAAHKKTAAALSDSEARVRSIIDNIPAEISLKDMQGRYRLVNQQFENWFGVSSIDVVGRTPLEVHPKGFGDAVMSYDRMVRESARAVEHEAQFAFADGEHTLLVCTFPILGDSRHVIGTGAVVTDITERKQAEEELRASRDEAERANRCKSEFLARMSHDFRTPLNAIIGFSEVMKDEILGPVGTPSYRDYARGIHESGHHLLDLVNDLLDISRIETGQFDLKRDVIVFPELAQKLARLFDRDLTRKRLTLRTVIEDGLPQLRADPRAMTQMLDNLLSNAVKFTPEGGVITIEARSVAGGLAVAVKDTGSGIEPAELDAVLAPIDQRDNSTMRTQNGSGLGLTIVKSLIELHGGSIALESAPGAGTRVTLHFPSACVGEPQA